VSYYENVEKIQLFVLFFQIIVDNASKHDYYVHIVTQKSSKDV